jgi:tetratricopeptide (TPR) repeat protein
VVSRLKAPRSRPPDDGPALEVSGAADRVPLRLTVCRGALGIELYQPVALGPLEVTEFSWVLPKLRFPVDLSGGVPVFRHRRGTLERLAFGINQAALSRWLGPRTEQVLGGLVRPPTVVFTPQGMAVGLLTREGGLAFDLLWAPRDGDARLVIANPRGIGLRGPALGYALRALDSALGRWSERRGSVVTIPKIAALFGRALLPGFGARAPTVQGVRFGPWRLDADHAWVELDASFSLPATDEQIARLLGLAELTEEGDDALSAGRLEAARDAYLVALERAPRHPELARLVAEIDLFSGDRLEAALGILVETMPAVDAGWVGAELLSRSGDLEAARVTLAEAARAERFAPLSALMWVQSAELAPTSRARLDALDRAVSSAPALETVRWLRVRARLELGDVEGALADAQHLEAASQGARARHANLCQAGQYLLAQGFVHHAGKLFERALRYLPDDAEALYGLARTLLGLGRGERAFAVLSRAVELGEKQGRIDCRVLLELGRYFAGTLHDLPQAIARVREIPLGSECGVEARALEAEWRVRLGDLIGASQAFARLRDTIELASQPLPAWSSWLVKAANFERDVQRDLPAAERHLALALRVAPRDPAIAAAYRDVSAVLAHRARTGRDRAQPVVTVATRERAETGVDLEVEISRLEEQLRANPEDLELVLELARKLELVGRDRELFALLSARLDEGTSEERTALLPRARAALERLVASAAVQGHGAEVEIYRMALERLG